MNVEIIKLTQRLSRTQAAAMVPHRPAAPGAERRAHPAGSRASAGTASPAIRGHALRRGPGVGDAPARRASPDRTTRGLRSRYAGLNMAYGLIALLAAFRPEGLRVLATTGHIHHGGTRFPVIPLVVLVLVLVIAGVIYAIRRSHKPRQTRQPDAWQHDQSRRYAAQSTDADPIFDKMANDAKRAVKQAEEEARSRRSDHIGSEHFLLGIASEPETVGARSLALCAARPQIIVAAINRRTGVPGGEPRTGTIPIRPSGTAVLEYALRESARLGHDYVGTGHLALGCLTASDGLAAGILNNLGVTYNDLRQAVAKFAPADPPKFSTKRAQWEQPGS